MSHSLIIDDFARHAESFVSWVKNPPHQPMDDAAHALAVLASIYSGAIQLMKVNVERREPDEDPENFQVSADEWKEVYERLQLLPLNHYQEVESPLENNAEVHYADLAENLTDIYQDIAEGLMFYQSNQAEQAICHWQMTFEFHWGQTVLSSMSALHRFFQEDADFSIFQ